MLLKKSFAAFLACMTVLGPVEAATSPLRYRVPLYVAAQAPSLAFATANVDLSAVAGQSAAADVVLSNTGNVPLDISGLTLQNTPSNVSLTDGCTGITLQVGASCTSRISYSATTAGNWSGTLTADSAGLTASVGINATGIADTASAHVYAVTASPTAIVASTDNSQLSAAVVDAYGNQLGSGIAVTWGTSLGALSSSTSTTGADGKAPNTFSSNSAGVGTITGKVGSGSAASTTVTVSGNPASARVGNLTVSSASITANGATSATLQATLTDANGNSLGSGIPVQWATTLGTLTASSSVTNASGVASAQLTSAKTAGSATLTAKTAADTVGKTASVAMVPDTATAAVSTVAALPTSLAANGSATSTVTATLKDANGNIVAGAPVSWTTTLGTLSAASSVTNASGAASVSLKAGTTLGNAVVTAKGISTDAGKTATISLVADTATAQVIAISASPSSLYTGNSTTVTASVQDAYGHALSGVPVYFSTTMGSVGSSVVNTNSSGVASTTTSSSSAGTATVYAGTSYGGNRSTAVTFVQPCFRSDAVNGYLYAQAGPGRESIAFGNSLIYWNGASTGVRVDANGNGSYAGYSISQAGLQSVIPINGTQSKYVYYFNACQ